jgi:hypothetical protein
MLDGIWEVRKKLPELLRLYDVRIFDDVDDTVGKILFVQQIFFEDWVVKDTLYRLKTAIMKDNHIGTGTVRLFHLVKFYYLPVQLQIT